MISFISLGFCYFQHKLADFVWVFADFKHATLANNGGFACLRPEHAGETRFFGHDPRNLRANNLRERGFLWFWVCLGPGFLARNKANSVAVKTKTISIQTTF